MGVNANWISAPSPRKDIASVRERRHSHVILDQPSCEVAVALAVSGRKAPERDGLISHRGGKK